MMLKKMMVGGLMVAALAAGLPAMGEARVNFSLNINAPPAFAVVPGAPTVQYAPQIVDNNVFQYGGRYYVYNGGTWYTGPRYSGPWAVVAPAYVPRPLLQVPVGYYHRPPANWRNWRHDAAPRWDRSYGRNWRAEHRDEHRVYR